MKGIYESLLLDGQNVNFIDRELAQRYLKWISYVPEFWNIDEILNKAVNDITSTESDYLMQYIEDQKTLVPMFIRFLYEGKQKESKNILDVHNYVKSHNLEDLMFNKMSTSEKLDCYAIVKDLKNWSFERLSNKIEELKEIPASERSIDEEYLLNYHLIPRFNKIVENNVKPILAESCDIEINLEKPMELLRK